MAVFDASGATQGFDFILSTAPDALDFLAQVTFTANTYSWTTTTGHLVTATGAFTYPGGVPEGTVTSISVDLGNNASPDIAITGIASASLAAMLVSFDGFYEAVLSGNDSFDLSQTEDIRLTGDFHDATVAGSIGGIDNFNFASAGGDVELYGDHYGYATSATGGNDNFNITFETATNPTTYLVGDVNSVSSGGSYTAGNDDFTVTDNIGRFGIITGDANGVFAGTLYGGDDSVTVLGTFAYIWNFYGDAGSLFGPGIVYGGDDFVTMGGTMMGDVANMGSGTLYGGNDTLTGSSSTEHIYGDVYTLSGDVASLFQGGNDNLTGNGGADVIYGDFETLDAAATMTAITFGADTVSGGGGNDTLFGDYGSDLVGILDSAGAGGADIMTGGAGDDQMFGGGGNDSLQGGTNDDLLNGGAGLDTLTGGNGNDQYWVTTQDIIVEGVGGIDMVLATETFVLAADDNIEVLATSQILGTTAINLTGNALAQSITGNAGVNVLEDGVGAADTLTGRTGNDTYVIRTATSQIAEGVGQGTVDRVLAAVTFVLAADDNIEVLQTTSFAGVGAINLTGNLLAQTITGNAGVNVLEDGAGAADTLTGSLGNDTYVIRTAGTLIAESAGQGTADLVLAATSFVLAADDDIETLQTTSFAGVGAINLTGNALAQTITGNAGANVLEDGAGAADTLTGSLGDDTYVIRTAGTVIAEGVGGGAADRASVAVSFVLAADDDIEVMQTTSFAGVGAINLTGNALAQTMTGNAGVNVLDGGAGNDTLTGGAGVDSFVFSTALAPANVDAITDFVVGLDEILLADGIFAGIGLGGLAAIRFHFGPSGQAINADVRIIYETDNGNLWYDVDGLGGVGRVQFGDLAAGLALTAGDFTVV